MSINVVMAGAFSPFLTKLHGCPKMSRLGRVLKIGLPENGCGSVCDLHGGLTRYDFIHSRR